MPRKTGLQPDGVTVSAIEAVVRLKGPNIGRKELADVDSSRIQIQKHMPKRKLAYCRITAPGRQPMTFIVGYGSKPTLSTFEPGLFAGGNSCNFKKCHPYLSGA